MSAKEKRQEPGLTLAAFGYEERTARRTGRSLAGLAFADQPEEILRRTVAGARLAPEVQLEQRTRTRFQKMLLVGVHAPNVRRVARFVHVEHALGAIAKNLDSRFGHAAFRPFGDGRPSDMASRRLVALPPLIILDRNSGSVI
jgi:hypothetical protein